MKCRQQTAVIFFKELLGNNLGSAEVLSRLLRSPNLLGDGDKGIVIVYGEKKIFLHWTTRAAKPEQKSLVPARQAQLTNQGRILFNCTL